MPISIRVTVTPGSISLWRLSTIPSRISSATPSPIAPEWMPSPRLPPSAAVTASRDQADAELDRRAVRHEPRDVRGDRALDRPDRARRQFQDRVLGRHQNVDQAGFDQRVAIRPGQRRIDLRDDEPRACHHLAQAFDAEPGIVTAGRVRAGHLQQHDIDPRPPRRDQVAQPRDVGRDHVAGAIGEEPPAGPGAAACGHRDIRHDRTGNRTRRSARRTRGTAGSARACSPSMPGQQHRLGGRLGPADRLAGPDQRGKIELVRRDRCWCLHAWINSPNARWAVRHETAAQVPMFFCRSYVLVPTKNRDDCFCRRTASKGASGEQRGAAGTAPVDREPRTRHHHQRRADARPALSGRGHAGDGQDDAGHAVRHGGGAARREDPLHHARRDPRRTGRDGDQPRLGTRRHRHLRAGAARSAARPAADRSAAVGGRTRRNDAACLRAHLRRCARSAGNRTRCPNCASWHATRCVSGVRSWR